jgi:hypothetical protein
MLRGMWSRFATRFNFCLLNDLASISFLSDSDGCEMRLGLLGWLPEGEGGSGGIDEDAHLAVAHDVAHILHDGGTERFGFGSGGFDVVDLNVGEP